MQTKKVQTKKVFWHVLLNSYLYNGLRMFFITIERNQYFSKTYSEIESTWSTNSNKEEIVWSCDSKELFVQQFCIQIKHKRGKIKEQTPKLTFKKLEYCFLVEATKIENTSCPFKTKNSHPSWLHCTVVGLSEAATRGALYKKLFLKVLIYSEENTYVGVCF